MNFEMRLFRNKLGFKRTNTMVILSAYCALDDNEDWQGFVATMKKYIKKQNSILKDKIAELVTQMKEEFDVGMFTQLNKFEQQVTDVETRIEETVGKKTLSLGH